MRFGQPVEFFDAAAQADAEQFAPSYGDEGMRELIALADGVLFAPRVEVGKDALTPPLGQRNHQAEGHQQNGGDEEEHAGVHPAQE